jgi:carbonic anhydrase
VIRIGPDPFPTQRTEELPMNRLVTPIRSLHRPAGALCAALCALLLQSGCQSQTAPDVAIPAVAQAQAAAGHAQAAAAPAAPNAPSANDALAQLVAGNRRFVGGAAKHPNQDAALRKQLAGGQHPLATIVGCSDSRVPAELVFDQGFGDLFVVRVAGNVVGVSELGSIEYAVHHLHTPLVVVLGHESCGAVTAALSSAADRQKEAQGIQALLNELEPGLTKIDPALAPVERVHKGVEANVRWSMQQLANTPELMHPHEGAAPTIVGAVYDLASGTVRVLPPSE